MFLQITFFFRVPVCFRIILLFYTRNDDRRRQPKGMHTLQHVTNHPAFSSWIVGNVTIVISCLAYTARTLPHCDNITITPCHTYLLLYNRHKCFEPVRWYMMGTLFCDTHERFLVYPWHRFTYDTLHISSNKLRHKISHHALTTSTVVPPCADGKPRTTQGISWTKTTMHNNLKAQLGGNYWAHSAAPVYR